MTDLTPGRLPCAPQSSNTTTDRAVKGRAEMTFCYLLNTSPRGNPQSDQQRVDNKAGLWGLREETNMQMLTSQCDELDLECYTNPLLQVWPVWVGTWTSWCSAPAHSHSLRQCLSAIIARLVLPKSKAGLVKVGRGWAEILDAYLYMSIFVSESMW